MIEKLLKSLTDKININFLESYNPSYRFPFTKVLYSFFTTKKAFRKCSKSHSNRIIVFTIYLTKKKLWYINFLPRNQNREKKNFPQEKEDVNFVCCVLITFWLLLRSARKLENLIESRQKKTYWKNTFLNIPKSNWLDLFSSFLSFCLKLFK